MQFDRRFYLVLLYGNQHVISAAVKTTSPSTNDLPTSTYSPPLGNSTATYSAADTASPIYLSLLTATSSVPSASSQSDALSIQSNAASYRPAFNSSLASSATTAPQLAFSNTHSSPALSSAATQQSASSKTNSSRSFSSPSSHSASLTLHTTTETHQPSRAGGITSSAVQAAALSRASSTLSISAIDVDAQKVAENKLHTTSLSLAVPIVTAPDVSTATNIPSTTNALEVLESALPSGVFSSIESRLSQSSQAYLSTSYSLALSTSVSSSASSSVTSAATTPSTTASSSTTTSSSIVTSSSTTTSSSTRTSSSLTSMSLTTLSMRTRPTTTTSATAAASSTADAMGSHPIKGSAIAGIASGLAAGAVLVGLGGVYLYRRHQQRKPSLSPRGSQRSNNSRSGSGGGGSSSRGIFPESAWLYDPVRTPPVTPSRRESVDPAQAALIPAPRDGSVEMDATPLPSSPRLRLAVLAAAQEPLLSPRMPPPHDRSPAGSGSPNSSGRRSSRAPSSDNPNWPLASIGEEGVAR